MPARVAAIMERISQRARRNTLPLQRDTVSVSSLGQARPGIAGDLSRTIGIRIFPDRTVAEDLRRDAIDFIPVAHFISEKGEEHLFCFRKLSSARRAPREMR